MDLLTLVRRQQEAENIFELFLGLYQSIAESGFSEAVRRVFSYDSSGQYRSWQLQTHPLARLLAEVIGGNPNSWVEEFPAARNKLAVDALASGTSRIA